MRAVFENGVMLDTLAVDIDLRGDNATRAIVKHDPYVSEDAGVTPAATKNDPIGNAQHRQIKGCSVALVISGPSNTCVLVAMCLAMLLARRFRRSYGWARAVRAAAVCDGNL